MVPTATNTNQDVNSPAYKNAAYFRQADSLKVVRDLAGGTPQMRKCRTIYLPMEEGESKTAYEVRLARSLLYNTFVKAREGLVGIGLPGRKPKSPEPDMPEGNGEVDDESNDGDIQLKDDVPLQLREHIEDIDLAGTHLDVFAKDFFRDVIQEGHAHILIDNQPALPMSVTSASPIPDASDDIATNRRPYWVKYKKDQAINFKSARINGETVLTQITFEECATEDEGEYGEKEVVRYRVLKLPIAVPARDGQDAVYGPMRWDLYVKRVVEGKEESVWLKGDQTALARIPVVTVYARKKCMLESDPPLIDLAYLNIGHWQQWSDLNSQLRMLVPVLVILGDLNNPKEGSAGGGQTKLEWGPGTVIRGDKDGDIKYVSHDGAAIKATRESLIDLEQRMSAVSLSLIAAKQDREVTATEKSMDQGERMSELASWLRNLKDGLEMAFHIHAVWYLGLKTGGSLLMGFDEPDETAKETITAINAPKGGMPNGQQMPPQSAEMMQ